MKKFNFKKILSKLKPTKREEYKTISSKAHHDWKVMLIFFFFLWIVIVLGSLYMFVEIDRGEIFRVPPKEEGTQTIIDKKILEETVKFFEERKIQLEKLKTEKLTTPDPSV